ncbi:MAG TPA: poly-gamma-glutamate hydrolase family protein, partial [Ilumatobacteraceae bacterium]|nr:poly-gamma-glutamate hydrolase family protein [Ilumatobacteraceae bacterium]
TMAGFLDYVDIVVTVHGFGRRGLFTTLLLGGRNRLLADHIGAALREALPDYDVCTDTDVIPVELRGLHPTNPVNLPRHHGVQIELPPRVRGSSPIWKDWTGPGLTPHTESLITALAEAATTFSL